MSESAALAVIEQQPPTLAVAPRVTAGDLVARLETIKSAAHQAMTENVDLHLMLTLARMLDDYPLYPPEIRIQVADVLAGEPELTLLDGAVS